MGVLYSFTKLKQVCMVVLDYARPCLAKNGRARRRALFVHEANTGMHSRAWLSTIVLEVNLEIPSESVPNLPL